MSTCSPSGSAWPLMQEIRYLDKPRERIYRRVMEQYPNASENQIKTLMK